MTLKKQSLEIAHIGIRFLAHRGDSKNEIIRVYRRKLIVYGNNYLLYVYRELQATFSSKGNSKIKQINKEHQERDKTSFWRAKRNFVRLIACNADNSLCRPVFWTFTFDPSRYKNITDLKIANLYFIKFRQKLTRKLGFRALYIAVPEFQKNGNVHYHVIFFNLPFIASDKTVFEKYPNLINKKQVDFYMKDIWQYGFVEPILLDGIRNVSLYLAKYMSKNFDSSTGNKMFGQKLYFCSRGLKRPEEYYNEIAIDNILSQQKLSLKSESKYIFKGLKIIHMTSKLE